MGISALSSFSDVESSLNTTELESSRTGAESSGNVPDAVEASGGCADEIGVGTDATGVAEVCIAKGTGVGVSPSSTVFVLFECLFFLSSAITVSGLVLLSLSCLSGFLNWFSVSAVLGAGFLLFSVLGFDWVLVGCLSVWVFGCWGVGCWCGFGFWVLGLGFD